MLPRRLHAACVAVAIAVSVLCEPVFGQIPPNMPVNVDLRGRILALGSGKIQVLTESGQRWLVDVSRRTSVLVTGTGDARLLNRGMYIQFQAQVSERQTVVGPIERIQIVAPTPPGATPSQGFGPAGVNPPDAGKDARPDAAGTKYDVIGLITGFQRGRLAVSYGRGTLQVELAPNVQVDLAVADLSFARPGDEIMCMGILVQPGTVQARSIRVTQARQQAQRPDQPPVDAAAEPAKDKDAQPAELPEEQQKPNDQIVKLLTLGEGKAKDEKFAIEGDPTSFQPCVKRSVASLRREFGLAVRTQVRGTLTMHGRKKRVTWQMWTWGPVRVIVDGSKKSRFFAVTK